MTINIPTLEGVFGKPFFRSLTFWGLTILGSAEAACQSGTLPPNICHAVNIVGQILTLLGLRKALTQFADSTDISNPPPATAAQAASILTQAAKS